MMDERCASALPCECDHSEAAHQWTPVRRGYDNIVGVVAIGACATQVGKSDAASGAFVHLIFCECKQYRAQRLQTEAEATADAVAEWEGRLRQSMDAIRAATVIASVNMDSLIALAQLSRQEHDRNKNRIAELEERLDNYERDDPRTYASRAADPT